MGMLALALLGNLNTECASTETLGQAVIAAFQQHPDHPIITSFPGLGDLTRARILGEIGDDRERFADARALKAFTLAPVTVSDRRLVSEPATAWRRQSLRTYWCCRCRPTLAGSHRAGRVPKGLRDSRAGVGLLDRGDQAQVSGVSGVAAALDDVGKAPGRTGDLVGRRLGLDGPRRQVQGSARSSGAEPARDLPTNPRDRGQRTTRSLTCCTASAVSRPMTAARTPGSSAEIASSICWDHQPARHGISARCRIPRRCR
jgi:hypothetical protein